MNKRLFQLTLAVALTTFFALGMTGCSSKRVVTTQTTKQTVVLDDQEKPLTEWVDCPSCDGKGTCANCSGKGKIGAQKCRACDGTGKCHRCNGEGGYRK